MDDLAILVHVNYHVSNTVGKLKFSVQPSADLLRLTAEILNRKPDVRIYC